MELYSQGRWLVHQFDSLGEFADSLVKHEYVHPDHGSMSTLLNQCRFGWEQELPATMELVESVTEKLIRERKIQPAFEPVWDVAGAVVDIGRFVSNEPECMISFPLATTTAKPVITLVTCMSLGWVSQQEVLAQGRAVCALAMALQATGHSVEIWSDNVTGFQGRWHLNPKALTHTVKVKVKGANDVLDPGQLMFALANYAMGRSLGDSIFPQLDGRINPQLEKKWEQARRRGGASAGDPCPDLYPEGALILPRPRSRFAEELARRGELSTDTFNADADMPAHYLQASVDFVMEHLKKLGIVAE
jgi:hypothetical protein